MGILVPVAALLAGAGIAVAGMAALRNEPIPAPVAAPDTGPQRIVLVADAYLGRPVGEVEAALAARGLQTERVPQETSTVPPGLVTGINPAGAVSPGDRVTVLYAVAPAPAPAAPVPAPAPVPVETVAGTARAPAADDQADQPAAMAGRGNGQAHGNRGKHRGGGRGKGKD